MKLNDPFGRVQNKQQQSYDSLRRSLIEAGVDSRAAAQSVFNSLLRRALVVALLVALLTASVWLWLPQMGAAALVLAFVVLFWLLSTTLNGCSLVRRFMRDELPD